MPRIYRDQVEAGSLLVIPSGTVVAPAKAKGTLTFSDSVADGETVTIGGAIYEFDTDSDTVEGNIAVDVSGGATASDAVTALVAAITANEDSVVTAVDGDGNTVDVTAVAYGTKGNSIAVGTDATNGEWAKATLAGGVDGTVAKKGTIMFDENYVHVAVDDCTATVSNWKKNHIEEQAKTLYINNRLIDLPFPRDPNKWDTEKVPLIDCHVADGWPTKFCSLDTEFTYKGLPTIKITDSNDEAPYITYLFTEPKDVTEYDYIECIIHTNDTDIVKPNYTDKIRLQVGEQGIGNTDNYESPINLYGIGTRTWKEPGWRRIRIPIRGMVQNGAGDLSAVGNVYLYFSMISGGHIEYHLAEINLIKVAKAQIYIDFDDGNGSDFTVGYPILNDLGLKATSYVNSISIGNSGKMNIEQLQYLQSVGWLVASHTHSHLNLGDEENEETIEYEIKTTFDFLKNNGIIPGCYFMSLPFGTINDTVRQIMKNYHISVRGQSGVGEDSIPANDKYDTKFISVLHETDIANYKAVIDRICNSKLSYHIIFHRLTDTNPQATVNTPAKFAEICNYIAYKRNAGLCEVVTPLQTMQCEGIVVNSNSEYTLLTPEGMNLKLERTTLDID